MKIIKRLKLFVVAAFVFLIAGNVSAATTITVDNGQPLESDPQSYLVTNVGTLQITGIRAGDEFNAYRILNVYYNQQSNQISYDFTDDFKDFLAQSSTYRDMTVETYQGLTSGSITSGSTQTDSTLDALVSAYTAYMKTYPNPYDYVSLTSSGNTASATLQAGSYLVLPVSTSYVYAVMVGNVELKAQNNDWNLENVSIVAKVSNASVEKRVGTSSNQEGSFSYTDLITYYVTATVPQYPSNSIHKTYQITDILSKGLSFANLNEIVAYDGETKLKVTIKGENHGEITNGDKLVADIKFNDTTLHFQFHLDEVKSTTIKLSYTVKLNENATFGLAGGNKNRVSLLYSNDPYGSNSVSVEDEATVYTYQLNAVLFETGEESIVLKDATFDVYSDQNLEHKISSITTDEYGNASLKGLAAGTYYLKQTKAPSGYSLLRDSIPVTISDATDEGDTGVVTVKVAATKIGALPITGGFGTIAFTVSGIMIIAAAILFVVVYKRKKKEQQTL